MSIYKINDNGIERAMTETETTEFDQTLLDTAKDQAAIEAEKKAKSQAKQNVLDKLGLTADEIAALLS